MQLIYRRKKIAQQIQEKKQMPPFRKHVLSVMEKSSPVMAYFVTGFTASL
jgi:ABC-type microcin C transport system permease subunit YejE